MISDPNLTTSPALPRQIGRYRVRARIGEGATSEVFLAEDGFRGCDVAIKRLRLPSAGHEDIDAHHASRFFAAEAALVGRLAHPNIVQLLDAATDGAQPYLVMEHVAGETLKHWCRPDRLLSLEQIVEVGFKCASALGYCWRQGLIHRDIKPANVLCVMDATSAEVQEVKITDFGSVLNLGSDHTQVLRVGSLSYMAPEQLEGIELDARADMYALAAVMYHLVCGRPPVQAPTQAAMMQAIARGEVPSLVGQREGVTPALDNFLRRALSRRREDRPANWEAFASGLAALVRWQQVPRATTQSVLDSERFSLLRALEFFADFDDVQLWEVARRARWQRFARGEHIYRKGEVGSSFHIIAQGQVEVFREGRLVASMDAGTSVGEMSYLAPNPALRTHSADVVASQPATTVCFTPDSLRQTTLGTRSRFDAAFIKVLVRRLHAAQESLAQARAVGPLAGVSPAATLPPVAPSRPRAVAPERARAAPRPFAESRFG
jgi:CRP-like cAMP-binding protein/tRNA A-37 threonylcarbamoyl transferase component Bud32